MLRKSYILTTLAYVIHQENKQKQSTAKSV